MGLYEKAKKTLKGEVEEEAEKEHKNEEHAEGGELVEHMHAMNDAYKSFRIPGQGKTDIDGYITLVKPKVCKLIDSQMKTMDAVKVQIHMWVIWRKEEEERSAHEVKVEKVFNTSITEAFQGSDVEELVRGMFVYFKTQVEHPALPKSGFILDHDMHLDIDLHRLELTRGSSYIELPEWIAKKKAVINPKNKDEKCLKWAVIASLHHEEIEKDPQCMSKLQPFVERYNWKGLEFPVALKEIGKFEKSNPEIAVNVLSVNKKSIYIARRSEFNGKRSKQVILLILIY